MGANLYFYEQRSFRKIPKRYRKTPEELPESLRFAHLNPKVAAFLASKERAQKQDEDPFGDGMGKKSLLPDINQAMTQLKGRLDSALSNDEDSQRYLFEEARTTAFTVLLQLASFLYRYENLNNVIPRSLEYQLMTSYKELTNDISYIPREWQTSEMKEQYAAMCKEATDEDSTDGNARGGTDRASTEVKKRIRSQSRTDSEDDRPETRQLLLKRSESRLSAHSTARSRVGRHHRGSVAGSVIRSPSMRKGVHDDLFSNIAETPSEGRLSRKSSSVFIQNGTAGNALPTSYNFVINFHLSSKECEDKGWIVQKGREDDVDQLTVLEYCVQLLQESMKATREQKAREKDIGYDKPVLIRYYGDTTKDTLMKYRKSPDKQQTNPVLKGEKPKIPSMHDDKNEGKKLMQTSHLDGTTVVYYPSGRPAIVHSAAGFGRPGYYTIIYEDGLDSKMMGCFTPSGRGVCYHSNGIARFLATDKGGHIAQADGTLIRKWRWPAGNVKITQPVGFQINQYLTFRCVGQSNVSVVFSCQKETARFSLNPVLGAVEAKTGDENEQLLTNFTFSSRAAKELMRLFAPKQKHKGKSKGKRQGYKGHIAELHKMLELPDKVQYDIEADKELARLQRKARNLVDDWMEHYRLAIGLTSPHLSGLQETPSIAARRRNIQSAQVSAGSTSMRRARMGLDSPDMSYVKKIRAPSAPAGPEKRPGSSSETTKEEPVVRKQASNVKFEEPSEAGGEGPDVAHAATALLTRLSLSAGKRRPPRSKSSTPTSRQVIVMSPAERVLSPVKSHCPYALRQQIQGEERPTCRCNRHNIPCISDIELDAFVQNEVPDGQLAIISVVSSVFPKLDSMLDELYASQNRNRTRPCVQGRTDMYKIYRYDINTAADGSDHTEPLLLIRHNVVPGMFLMYHEGKLLFCDHIFNGYGSARIDFKKQVMKSRLDAIHGFSLPKDFRFSPSRGRSGPRSAWGGEIGGAGVDRYGSPGTSLDSSLVPLYQSSSSSAISSDSRDFAGQRSRGIETAHLISMSLSPAAYRQPTELNMRLTDSTRHIQGTVM